MNAPSLDNDSPLDVERVEWLPATSETVTVLVVGRWRGAVPAAAPELLVEGEAFAADEHGAIGPVWRATFSVTIELRPALERRMALRMGGDELTLPAASAGPTDEDNAPPPAQVVEHKSLEERRARRVEGAEESLVRRAQAAEATALTLRTQLTNLEERLGEATLERDALERDLRAAEQREEAERRVRAEAVEERDAAKADAERRLGALRSRVKAAEDHATELAREMDAVRREAAEAAEAATTARRAAEAREAELAERLGELGTEAGGVGERLGAERRAREAAERALAAERDRVAEAGGRVAALEAELERRAEVQRAIRGEIDGLREALSRVRAQAESGGEASELRATAAGLRARVDELERGERTAREERERQAGELERARMDLETARAELGAARDAESAKASALREAERVAEDVRREAGELRRRLDDERRRRFEVEASLRADLEREREELGGRLAVAEGSLRAQVAAERRAFEDQTEAIERTARELRERLTVAVGELEARLAGERSGREAAEREAAALRAELDATRGELAERAAREAEVGELVHDLLSTSTDLREGFERELRGLEEELRSNLADERQELRSRLEALGRNVAGLRAELDRERTAREEAERELALERGRKASGSEAGLHELEKAKGRIAAAQEQLERAQEREDLHAQARAMIRNLEDAERRLRTEREALEAPGEAAPAPPGEAPAPAPQAAAERMPAAGPPAAETPVEPLPPEPAEAPEPAEPTGPEPVPSPPPEPVPPSDPVEPLPPAAEAPGLGDWASSVVEPEVTPEPEPEAPAPAADAPPVDPDSPEYALHRAAEELAAAQRAAAERAAARRAARRAGARAPSVERLQHRVVPREQRTPTRWLLEGLEILAATEPRAASRLLVGLLPAQGPSLGRPLTYEIAVDGDGTWRVEIAEGVARVEPRPPGAAPDPTAEFRVAGPPSTLAPLAAGHAARRLPDARVTGKRRRLRRLLKARRDPVTLDDLARHGVTPEPAILLRALAAAIDPSWTAGHRFSVAYEILDAERVTVYVTVADGAPVAVEATTTPTQRPTATVSAPAGALIALLGRAELSLLESATVTGDAEAVARLHAWTDRVQGIPSAG